MGAYNVISIKAPCPFCGVENAWAIQFKYGDCWQYQYRIGDRLRWGGNNRGAPVAGLVRADGVAEGICPACRVDEINAAVYVRDGLLDHVDLLVQPLPFESDQYYERC